MLLDITHPRLLLSIVQIHRSHDDDDDASQQHSQEIGKRWVVLVGGWLLIACGGWSGLLCLCVSVVRAFEKDANMRGSLE